MKTNLLLALFFLVAVNLNLFAQIDSGLVAYYPFNGNAIDASGNGNNGVVNGASLTQDRFDRINEAYSFNGINNSILIATPNFNFNYNSSFTVSAWVKLDNLEYERAFVWNGTVGGGNFVWTLDVYQGYLRFGAAKQQSDWFFAQIPTTSLNTETWYNFVGVYDNRNIHLYVNGTEVANNYFGYTDSQQSTLPLSIGAHALSVNNLINYFKGNLDEIRIYNRALSPSEIAQLNTGTYINMKLLFEGMFYPIFNQLTRIDSVTAYLHLTTPPFNIIDSAKSRIDSVSFSGLFKFSNVSAGNFYISVKHLNSPETWSKAGGEYLANDGTVYNYDFTTFNTQAYGNNLILKGSKYCLFSGDLNHDGFIDLEDLVPVFNDATDFLTGRYLTTDLNGDSIVDLTDITISYKNSINFVRVIHP